MSNFEKIGFLAEDPSGIRSEIQLKFGDHLAIAQELNEYMQAKQYELAPRNNEANELLATMLFARALSTYQSVLLLVEKGMKHQVQIVLRSMYEPVFQISSLANDPSFIKAMMDDDLIRRKRGIQSLIDYFNRNKIQGEQLDQARDKRIELRKELKKRKPKCKEGLSISTIAKTADMMDCYDVAYSYHSSTVHCSLLSLEEDFILDDNGVVTSLRNEPSTDGIKPVLSSAVELMCLAMIAANQVLKLALDTKLEEIRCRNQGLSHET
jgi:hypothetical protein